MFAARGLHRFTPTCFASPLWRIGWCHECGGKAGIDEGRPHLPSIVVLRAYDKAEQLKWRGKITLFTDTNGTGGLCQLHSVLKS